MLHNLVNDIPGAPPQTMHLIPFADLVLITNEHQHTAFLIHFTSFFFFANLLQPALNLCGVGLVCVLIELLQLIMKTELPCVSDLVYILLPC